MAPRSPYLAAHLNQVTHLAVHLNQVTHMAVHLDPINPYQFHEDDPGLSQLPLPSLRTLASDQPSLPPSHPRTLNPYLTVRLDQVALDGLEEDGMCAGVGQVQAHALYRSGQRPRQRLVHAGHHLGQLCRGGKCLSEGGMGGRRAGGTAR